MSPELSLDIKQIFIPKTISQFLEDISKIDSLTEKVLQVDDFVSRLESEKRKMEAFEHEVPLSMLLINDAIVALKEKSMVLKKSLNVEPVLEEFMPLKNSCDDNDDVKVEINEENGDKKNWLSSTHLWNANENLNQKSNSVLKTIIKKAEEEEDVRRAIFSPEINGNSRLIPLSSTFFQSNIQIGSAVHAPLRQQTSRKQRRCWSTELHRRFVNALQQLGGSQVATPKQIRELMQVDGLTNDEVKSHLQKYRLHSRRLPSSNTTQPSGVVVGGLWMSKCTNSQSSSPDGPLPTGGNSMDDEDDDEKSENNWYRSVS